MGTEPEAMSRSACDAVARVQAAGLIPGHDDGRRREDGRGGTGGTVREFGRPRRVSSSPERAHARSRRPGPPVARAAWSRRRSVLRVRIDHFAADFTGFPTVIACIDVDLVDHRPRLDGRLSAPASPVHASVGAHGAHRKEE